MSYKTDQILEIVKIAEGVLDKKVDSLAGIRILSSYRNRIEIINEELLILSGIASQTEEFPLTEEQRKTWSSDALSRLDHEKEEFLSQTENIIRETCTSILSKLNHQ